MSVCVCITTNLNKQPDYKAACWPGPIMRNVFEYVCICVCECVSPASTDTGLKKKKTDIKREGGERGEDEKRGTAGGEEMKGAEGGGKEEERDGERKMGR